MRRNQPLRSWTLGLMGLVVFAGSLMSADELVRFRAKSGSSKVTIEGTSTIHDWTMEGLVVGGFVEMDPRLADPAATPAPGKANVKAEVLIPVNSIHSGKTTMDNVYLDAMTGTKYPRIYYKLKELSVKAAAQDAKSPIALESVGDLIVSGITNQISVPVRMERPGPTLLKFSGSLPLRMTTFGVKPPQPAIAGGLIKTGDEVRIGFEWVVEKQEMKP